MNEWLRAALAAQALAWPIAYAETVPGASENPADAKVAVPEPKYESAFDGFRHDVDPKLRLWREANDEAAALGGHRGQLRGKPTASGEARNDEAPAARPPRGAR